LRVINVEHRTLNFFFIAHYLWPVTRNDLLLTPLSSRSAGWICKCGEKLNDDLQCPVCKLKYKNTHNGLKT
jgi:hypothetical protein